MQILFSSLCALGIRLINGKSTTVVTSEDLYLRIELELTHRPSPPKLISYLIAICMCAGV